MVFYNNEVTRFQTAYERLSENKIQIDDFIDKDETKISWTSSLKANLERGILLEFDETKIVDSLYRPYSKQRTYFNGGLTHRVGQLQHMFPNNLETNQVISVTGRGSTKEFSALISNEIPDLEMISKGQCFPLDVYEFSDGVETAERTNERTNERTTNERTNERTKLYTAKYRPISPSASPRPAARASLCLSPTKSPIYTLSATHNAFRCSSTRRSNQHDDLYYRTGHDQRLFRADDRCDTRCPVADERAMLPNVPLRNGGSIMENQDLFAAETSSEKQPAQKKLVRRSAITDDALAHFREPYSATDAARIGKEDIFYYIYGLLHSEEYRERYADNLSKQLPRIPRMKTYANFAAFSKAGRDLAALHLNYETVPMYQDVKFSGSLKGLKLTPQQIIGGTDEDFRVVKMKFAKKDDKTKIVYNGKITVENIPEAAYDYIVNGKPAIEWVMERQAVSIDTKGKSGIVNDANDYAIETMHNPRYPLELLLRVITVSLETQKIVNNLPALDIVGT